jgi:hypothetical protein
MNEVPKIVHHRLRAATPAREVLEQTHPVADVLTAFSEQALAAEERESVLQHLALCADCRDVVVLALPEMDMALPPVEDVTGEFVPSSARSEASKNSKISRKRSDESWFRWGRLRWAHLRWATLAAGIVVAVFVVRPELERTVKPQPAVNSAANQLSAPAAHPESASHVALSTQSANSAPATLAGTLAKDTLANKDAAVRRPLEKQAGNAAHGVESKAGAAGAKSAILAHPRTGLPTTQAEMQLAGNMPLAGGNVKQSERATKESFSAGMPAGPDFKGRSLAATRNLQADKPAASESAASEQRVGESTTVEVASGSEMVSTEEAPSSEPSLIARADGLTVPNAPIQNAPKIEKAKPALDETTRDASVNGKIVNEKVNESQTSAQKELASPPAASSQAKIAQLGITSKATPALKATPSAKLQGQSATQNATTQNATWIIADGELQRSLDAGHTWQPAARAPLSLLCYANRGQDIWAGGQSGTLLHSADNGATWNAVTVSFKGQSLSSDVITLSFPGPAQIVLSTNTHEIWSSADAGKTWEKK